MRLHFAFKTARQEKEKSKQQNFIIILLDFEQVRRRSIKDEFAIAKELQMKMNIDEELAPEVIEETMKNTLYNKIIGKREEEND